MNRRYDNFKNYHIESQTMLKTISKGIIEEGEFTKIDKDILDLSERFITKITELANYETELGQYINFIDQNPDLHLSYCDLYSNNASEVMRFGINTAIMTQEHSNKICEIYTYNEKKGSIRSGTKSSKSQKDSEVSKTLHPLEVFLIQDAIEFLKEKNSKAVLIDIFVREDDGRISIKDNVPDIHTVVLYFNSDIGKIIVIDPSSPEFSRHIATNNLRLFGQSDDYVEITIPQLQKIYAPFDRNNVGPRPDQYRDCVDISVKIALGLNKLNSYINTTEIMSSNIIKEMTNQKQSNENLFFTNEEVIARIRQASDDEIREKINKVLVFLDQQRKSILNYPQTEDDTFVDTIYERNIEKFRNQFLPSQYKEAITKFKLLCQDNTEKCNEYTIKVLGEIVNDG